MHKEPVVAKERDGPSPGSVLQRKQALERFVGDLRTTAFPTPHGHAMVTRQEQAGAWDGRYAGNCSQKMHYVRDNV